MAPSNTTYLPTQLRHLIYYHIDNNLMKNALFLAQRLVAYEHKSPESAFLLAHCQYQSGFVKGAYDTSWTYGIRGSHLGCAYIFAQACLELGRYVDGLTALEKSKVLWQNRSTWNQHTESRRQHLPDAAAVLTLKGKLWKAHKNDEQAVECWAAALKLNPFMSDAFEGLCDSGVRIHVPNIFKLSPEMEAVAKQAHRAENTQLPPDRPSVSSHPLQSHSTNRDATDPFVATTKPGGHGSTALWEKLNGSKVSVNTLGSTAEDDGAPTPSTVADTDDGLLHGGPVGGIYEPPAAPIRKARSANEVTDPLSRFKTGASRTRARGKGASEEAAILPDPAPPLAPNKRTISGHVANTASSQANAEGTRRSNRLAGGASRPPSAAGPAPSKLSSFTNSLGLRDGRDIKKPRAPTVKGRVATTSTVGRVVSGNRPTRTGATDAMDAERRDAQIPPVPSLTHHKVRSEGHSVNYHLEALNTLLGIGKSYYEQALYADAEKFFVRVRQLAPARLEDMEIYSTVLWHLKADIELAYLAHELMDIDRLSPQAWVAVGNSFSLQREHEQALRCFRRATQLDPSFAYGFTLQGHEHIASEEFEKALDATAAPSPPTADTTMPERHYRSAANINPTNAVLICCIGVVLERLKQYEPALAMYSRACVLSPGSALSRFKKARCLMVLYRPKEALEELKILQDVAPEEANVWFLMGRLYKMLGRRGEAVGAFTRALNLDPKAAQYIKDALENLENSDDDMEEDEDME
ncbi:Protein bimA [Cyphellophora attinorum]|uniref:Protein bimA n=1 Tax=Cyphellophora attinorum TaxID=1664694 RepID=A0A0N1HPZ9_9EURO|nr:Protein bimA [Phialophora attinorum]KPI39927.1 Protein bimA [Phialophora attinorum]